MRRWRWVIAILLLLAIVVLILSAVFGDWTPSRLWGRRPVGVRTPFRGLRDAMNLDDDLRFNLAGVLAGLITHLLFGMLILNLVPRRIHQMVIQIRRGWPTWVRTLAVGLFLTVGLVALSFLSTFAIHTMPVIILLLIGFLFASAVGMIAIAYAIGQALLSRAEWLQKSPILTLAFGILILFSLTRIPYLGGISLLLLWFVGTGISILTRFGSGEAWPLQSLMEEMET